MTSAILLSFISIMNDNISNITIINSSHKATEVFHAHIELELCLFQIIASSYSLDDKDMSD